MVGGDKICQIPAHLEQFYHDPESSWALNYYINEVGEGSNSIFCPHPSGDERS